MKRYLLLLLVMLTSTHVQARCYDNFATSYIDRYIIHTNGTVTDRLTGLMWMRCDVGRRWDSNLGVCSNAEGTPRYTWEDALTLTRDIRNGVYDFDGKLQPTGGYKDWRLPNVKEIASIIQRNCETIKAYRIDDSVFLDPAGVYWSSTPALKPQKTTLDGTPVWQNGAWVGNFTSVQRVEPRAMGESHSIRLVRDAVNNLGAN